MDTILLHCTFKKYIDLKFIETISPKDLLFWGGTILTLIFIIKNSYIAFLIFLQGILIKKVRSNLSVKMFKLYMNAPYKIHYEKNPAEILRNIDGETSGAVTILLQIITLFREFIILSAIFILLVLVDTLISFLFFNITLLVGIFFLQRLQ